MKTEEHPFAATPDALSSDPETLLACAKLLALGIANHRARFGAVPLSLHAETVPELLRAPREFPLGGAAESAFQEALALVTAVQPAVASTAASSEKRRQPRISLSAPVKLSDPGSRWLLAGTVLNISWGGASVRCKGLLGEVGQRVCVHLPAVGGPAIQILSTILRVDGPPPDSIYGLRFDSLAAEDEARLQQVLKLLMNTSPSEGRRSEPRLVQRLEIEYGDAGEFRATLEDISSNGMMLTVPEPLEIEQSLLLTLSCADVPQELNLRARVMHQSKLGSEEFSMYRVGLQFEHPNETVRKCVAAILTDLLLHPSASLPAA